MTPTIAWIVIGIMAAIIFTLSYFLVKFALIIFEFEDRTEEALELLEEKEASIRKILETPLFFDSPQVRKVVSDIKESQKVILGIIEANSLSPNTDKKDADIDVEHEG